MTEPGRHVVNISEEVYQKLIRKAQYGDSVDTILRRLLRMRVLRRGPKRR